MTDLSDFLPVGATFVVAGVDSVDVTTDRAVYTLDADCRSVTVKPRDAGLSVDDLRELLTEAMSLQSDLDDEAWACVRETLGLEPEDR